MEQQQQQQKPQKATEQPQQPNQPISIVWIILPIIIAAGLYGYQKHYSMNNDGNIVPSIFVYDWNLNRNRQIAYGLYKEIYTTIQQHPLLSEHIIEYWWKGWLQSFIGTFHHSYKTFLSFIFLLHYTIQPLLYLFYYLIIRFVFYFVLYNILVKQILLSPVAVNQIKVLVYEIIKYQKSLSYQQVGIELAIITSCIALRYTYQFYKRQTYIKRVKLYFRKQRLAVIKSYRKLLDRIAQFSSVVAAMTPHVLFLLLVTGCKLLVPRVIQWIACETALTNILHWYYPIIATILLIHDIQLQQHEKSLIYERNDENGKTNNEEVTAKQRVKESNETITSVLSTKSNKSNETRVSSFFSRTKPSSSISKASRTKVAPTTRKMALQQKQQQEEQHQSTKSRRKQTSLSSRLLGPTKASSARENEVQQRRRTKTGQTVVIPTHHKVQRGTGSSLSSDDDDSTTVVNSQDTIESRTKYWINYWTIIAAFGCIKKLLYLLPIVGRFLFIRTLSSIGQQLELIFWIWLNVMPAVTPASIQRQHRPILQYAAGVLIQPFFERSFEAMSTVILVETWDTCIVQNVTKISTPFVWAKFITQDRADSLIHFIQEYRVMVVPTAIVLSWPISSYGVTYAQYGLPLAKLGPTKRFDEDETSPSSPRKDARTDVHWLQFWILHSIVGGLIHKFASVLWFIPFSNVIIFGIFTFLVLVQSKIIDSFYDNLIQKELQAFGLLHTPTSNQDEGEGNERTIEEAKLVRFVHLIISKLPRAHNPDDDIDEDGYRSDGDNRSDEQQDYIVPNTSLESKPSSNEGLSDDDNLIEYHVPAAKVTMDEEDNAVTDKVSLTRGGNATLSDTSLYAMVGNSTDDDDVKSMDVISLTDNDHQHENFHQDNMALHDANYDNDSDVESYNDGEDMEYVHDDEDDDEEEFVNSKVATSSLSSELRRSHRLATKSKTG